MSQQITFGVLEAALAVAHDRNNSSLVLQSDIGDI